MSKGRKSLRPSLARGHTGEVSDRSRAIGPLSDQCYWLCGGPADSREHLIPEWVDDAFELPDGWTRGSTRLHTTSGGMSNTRQVQRIATRLLASKAVCTPCNTGWMSIIENQTKSLLAPLIRGESLRLEHSDQLQIALWACMKAAVADARPDSAHAGFASASIRAAIYERREPPIDMGVRLAAIDEGHTFALFNPFGVGTGRDGQYLAQWVTTFLLGHLVVQVMGRTGSTLPGVLEQCPAGIHDGRSFTVWPPQPAGVDWPPRLVLQRDDLARFLTEPCPQLEPIKEPLGDPTSEACSVCGKRHGPLRRRLPVAARA